MNITKSSFFKTALAACLVLTSLGLQAGSIVAGTFVAEALEDYEGTPGKRTTLTSLFGGSVSVAGSVLHWSVDEGDWRDFRTTPSIPIVPVSGTKFGAGTGFGESYSLDFSGLGGIFGFSGWFSSAGESGERSESIEFFGAGDTPLGTILRPSGFGPGNGTMEFISIISSVAIQSLLITGYEIASDDLAYSSQRQPATPVPVPGTLVLFGLGLCGFGFSVRKRR